MRTLYLRGFLALLLLQSSLVFAQDPSEDSVIPKQTVPGDAGYFTNLQEAIKDPEKVEVLVLKGRKLDSIPADIFRMVNLIHLDLSRNKIDSLPAEIGMLTRLEHLDLSNNKLESLPEEIGKLTSLHYLKLNRNVIRQLPPAIGELSELEVLELWDNELEDLPDEIGKLQNLRLLELRGILFSEEMQTRIDSLVVRSAKINMSPACACKN
ncbi:MAG: scribbled planar cell polarity protein [Bacteroidota bacterium]|jgi:Leucine-rich repeat (LRR) protein